ncbi:MAG TPA: hypothetical protein VN541_03535 [Tepidisphaeraceae bacterium]|nr:hypothetical protein [Tepidisphaeraceae bacterium]
MRWVSGLTGRRRLRILLPWLAPWLVLNVLWLSWLQFRLYAPWLNRLFGLTQFLLVGAILSLAWNERKFRKPGLPPHQQPESPPRQR